MLKESVPVTDAAARAEIAPKKKRRSRRKWCYAMRPAVYGIPPCKCGNADLQWSEWKRHVWCDRCKLDFVPEHNGVFDGPIPLGCANMMGIRFDRIDIKANKIIRQEEYLNATER